MSCNVSLLLLAWNNWHLKSLLDKINHWHRNIQMVIRNACSPTAVDFLRVESLNKCTATASRPLFFSGGLDPWQETSFIFRQLLLQRNSRSVSPYVVLYPVVIMRSSLLRSVNLMLLAFASFPGRQVPLTVQQLQLHLPCSYWVASCAHKATDGPAANFLSKSPWPPAVSRTRSLQWPPCDPKA